MKQKPWALTIEEMVYRFSLSLLEVQLAGGQWKTYVETADPNLVVEDIHAVRVPYRPPWYHQIRLLSGAGIGKAGNNFVVAGSIGLAIQNHQLSLQAQVADAPAWLLHYQRRW